MPLMGPQLALVGAIRGLGLDCGPVTLQKSSVGCIRSRVYTKKNRYSDPHRRARSPIGAPLSLAGVLVPVASH